MLNLLEVDGLMIEIVSIDIKWESSGHKTPDGKPIPIIRYGLLNLTATKTKEKEGERYNFENNYCT
jgi:hypothetical protein